MQNNTVLRVKAVAARLDISTGTVWNKCNPKSRHYDPDFPRPFKISANATGWLENEINAYIVNMIYFSYKAASRRQYRWYGKASQCRMRNKAY